MKSIFNLSVLKWHDGSERPTDRLGDYLVVFKSKPNPYFDTIKEDYIWFDVMQMGTHDFYNCNAYTVYDSERDTVIKWAILKTDK